ncbi:MAG: DegT/DnrJ/EryC1/StrS family aminotransferase [Desulfurivibrionaceae bacterium]
MNVPLLDLSVQLQELRQEIIDAVVTNIDSNRYILGPEVERLEENISHYCHISHGVGVSSGTDALLAGLMALGVGQGDKVITTPYTFFATIGSILRLGAEPVFVDIDPATFNINPSGVAEILSDSKRRKGIKAIVPVHLFGQCADMNPLLELAGQNDIAVLEDAAQAIGALYPDRSGGSVSWKRAGAMGNAGCFSFFPSKNLGCMGDGGMVITDDPSLAEKLRILRVHGGLTRYHHSTIGGNFRLDAMQAAILNVKLKQLSSWHKARRANAALYGKMFADAGLLGPGYVKLPEAVYEEQAASAGMDDYHVFNQYIIRAAERDRLKDHLSSRGVGAAIYYPLPLHQQECVQHLDVASRHYREAEKAAAETLALPIYPGLTSEMIEYVVDSIKQFYLT